MVEVDPLISYFLGAIKTDPHLITRVTNNFKKPHYFLKPLETIKNPQFNQGIALPFSLGSQCNEITGEKYLILINKKMQPIKYLLEIYLGNSFQETASNGNNKKRPKPSKP